MSIPLADLASPADADNFRMTVDWGRWYIDPLPTCQIAAATEDRWPSCSTVKKAADKDWSFLTVNRLAALPPAEWHRIADLDATQRGDAIRSHEKLAKNIAFGRGTIVHLWAEDCAAGRDPRVITDEWLAANRYPTAARDEAAQYRTAIVDFFQTYQPELMAAEYVTIHRTLNDHGYGATPDGVFRIEGELVGVDWKTRGPGSSHAAYSEEAAQIACGAKAEYMIAKEGDRAVRRQLPDITGGYVVSIRPDGARLYPIDIDKAFDHWTRLHEWWTHRLTEKASIGRVLPARSAPKISTGTASPPSAPSPSNTRRDALLARYRNLADVDRQAFLALNIPKDDLDAIEEALDRVDPFQQTIEPDLTVPATVPVAPPDTTDNDPVTTETKEALNAKYGSLSPAAQELVTRLMPKLGDPKKTPDGRPTRLYAARAHALLTWAPGLTDEDADQFADVLAAASIDDAERLSCEGALIDHTFSSDTPSAA